MITVVFLITVALIAGMVSHVSPSQYLEIRTWYDLNAIRDNLGGSYLLMNDLDSTTPGYEELASETANQGKGWQPIGAFIHQQVDHGVLGFEGTFDGQGHEIRDLFINRPDEDVVGLFFRVGEEGVIKEIGVVNATVTGHLFVGTLVGWNHGAVRDSYFTGNMTGDGFFVGGLVGGNFGTVSDSHSTGSVTGNSSIGGLVGQNYGTVSNSYSSANVVGTLGVGGLVGTGAGTVSKSYFRGNATGEGFVGGLIGSNDIGGTLTNSYSTGSVTGNHTVGGLVGYTFDGTVSDSYSTASVTGNYTVGGLVGQNERSTVSNSFWDTETSEQTTSDGGTGKTTAEMKSMATFSGAGWNIIAVANPGTRNPSYIWNIVDGQTYPFLSWAQSSIPTNKQPVDVLSVIGPLSPINPGGPIVEITLKNVSSDPVTSLSATLQLNRAFNFNFDVTSSNPLLPDKSISARLTLITGGFSDNISYSLAINGTLQDGEIFSYTKQVQIVMLNNK